MGQEGGGGEENKGYIILDFGFWILDCVLSADSLQSPVSGYSQEKISRGGQEGKADGVHARFLAFGQPEGGKTGDGNRIQSRQRSAKATTQWIK